MLFTAYSYYSKGSQYIVSLPPELVELSTPDEGEREEEEEEEVRRTLDAMMNQIAGEVNVITERDLNVSGLSEQEIMQTNFHRYWLDEKSVLYHMHIQKTGGTFFSNFLARYTILYSTLLLLSNCL